MQDAPRFTWSPIDRAVRGGIAVACLMAVAAAREGSAADSDQQPRGSAQFQPGDISIGDPIALPFAAPATPPVGSGGPVPQQQAVVAVGPAGWLGMAVAESSTPGRWSIVEVAADGPAAAAGIRTGDELRGVNGQPITSTDHASQALTSITAGQRIRLSVARADQVGDVEVVAIPRPVAAAASRPAREWQAAEPPAELPAAPAPATVSVLTSPPAASRTDAVAHAAPVGPPAALPAPSIAVPSAVAPRALPAARGRTALGVRTLPIDRGIQERFRLPAAAGAYVIGVVGELPASKAGIPPGSVIVSLADRPVRSPQELTQLVASGPTDRPVPLAYVLPGGVEKRAEVVLQSLELPLEQALTDGSALQPAAPPSLEPGPTPRMARRPEADAGPDDAGELRREMGRLRTLLEALERRLERLAR